MKPGNRTISSRCQIPIDEVKKMLFFEPRKCGVFYLRQVLGVIEK
jgi:hypothetical protein